MAKYLSVEELCKFLNDNHISSDITDRIRRHQINGEAFLELSSDELKEIAPVLGERIALRKWQAKLADQDNPDNTETNDPVPSCPILPNIEPENQFFSPHDNNHPMYLPPPAYTVDPSQSAMLMLQPAPVIEVPVLYPTQPHTAGYNAVQQQPYTNAYLENYAPRYIHTQFHMNDKCCLGNQFWVNIWLLILAIFFGQLAIPFIIIGLVFACKAASLNTGEIEKFEQARVWEKRAAVCGDIGYWVVIGMITVGLACTLFGIPIAIIILVVAIPLWVVASKKENNLYKYNENIDSA